MNTENMIVDEIHHDVRPWNERNALPLTTEMSHKKARRFQRAQRNGGNMKRAWSINRVLTGKVENVAGKFGKHPGNDRRALPGKKRIRARRAVRRGEEG